MRSMAGVLTFGARTRWLQLYVTLMVDEILADLMRLKGENHSNEDVMFCQYKAFWELDS